MKAAQDAASASFPSGFPRMPPLMPVMSNPDGGKQSKWQHFPFDGLLLLCRFVRAAVRDYRSPHVIKE
jgi:hypothetical protein